MVGYEPPTMLFSHTFNVQLALTRLTNDQREEEQ
jgi:hypothetical protein